MRVREQRVVECPTPQLQALDGAMDTLYMVRRGECLWPPGNTEVGIRNWMVGICLTPGLERTKKASCDSERGGGDAVKSHSELQLL